MYMVSFDELFISPIVQAWAAVNDWAHKDIPNRQHHLLNYATNSKKMAHNDKRYILLIYTNKQLTRISDAKLEYVGLKEN